MANLITVDDFPACIREAWGAHEVLRRIGFPSDDLYFLVSKSVELAGKLGIFVKLQRDDREFNYFCGPVEDHSEQEIGALWQKFIRIYNAGGFGNVELQRIFDTCDARLQAVQMMVVIREKGIQLPMHKRSGAA